MNTFGERLKKLRQRSNISQSELASRLNIAKSTLAMYEIGQREPNFETLQQIANFFDVTTDYLLGRTDEPKPAREDEVDIKKILEQKEKAHWDGRELTAEEKKYLSKLIQVAIQRDKGATDKN